MARDPENLSAAHATPTAELVEIYDDWSDAYDDDVRSWGYEVPERLARRLSELVAPQTTPYVFDAGCGSGLSGVALQAAGFTRVLGGDVSPQMLARAAALGCYEETRVVDLTSTLPWVDRTFDAAVSAGVFTYLPDPEAVIRELTRVTSGPVVFSQRTDLWASREMDGVVARLRSDGFAIEVSVPQSYLPGHPEYADDIRVIEVVVSGAVQSSN